MPLAGRKPSTSSCGEIDGSALLGHPGARPEARVPRALAGGAHRVPSGQDSRARQLGAFVRPRRRRRRHRSCQGVRGTNRPRGVARSARGGANCCQGRHRCGRRSHHRLLPGAAKSTGVPGRRMCRAAKGRRGGRSRQARLPRVRYGRARLRSALAAGREPVGCGTLYGRLEQRIRGGGRSGALRRRARHRYRRLNSHTCCLLRAFGVQADARLRRGSRNDSPRVHLRRARSAGENGRGLRDFLRRTLGTTRRWHDGERIACDCTWRGRCRAANRHLRLLPRVRAWYVRGNGGCRRRRRARARRGGCPDLGGRFEPARGVHRLLSDRRPRRGIRRAP